MKRWWICITEAYLHDFRTTMGWSLKYSYLVEFTEWIVNCVNYARLQIPIPVGNHSPIWLLPWCSPPASCLQHFWHTLNNASPPMHHFDFWAPDKLTHHHHYTLNSVKAWQRPTSTRATHAPAEFVHQGLKWCVDGHVWGSLEHEGRPKKWEIHQVSPVFCLELSCCWQYMLLHLKTSSIISWSHHLTACPSSMPWPTSTRPPQLHIHPIHPTEHGPSHPISMQHTKWHETNDVALFLIMDVLNTICGALILCGDLKASGM